MNKQRREEGRTPNKTTQGTGNPNKSLDDRSKQELYNRARDMGIEGRSSMTKSELIDAVARRSQITKSRAEMVVNCVFDSMTAALERGEGIEIRGFGSFTVRPYKPYDGRNPRTGQPVPVPAKRLPFFKVGKELKELVNSSRIHAITGGDDDDDDTSDA